MARRTRRLGVWLDGVHVADLEQPRWPAIRCRYTQAALEAAPLNSPLLSCSLPLGSQPLDAAAFCRGLLPEGRALQAMAAQAGLAVNETFELLARFGRDVAGALVIAAEPPSDRGFGAEPYTADGLAAAVGELDEHPLGLHDDSELSLAGMQDKLLLVRLSDGHWARPIGGRPSTHILKVDDPRYPGLIVAEARCLALARAAGLAAAEAELTEVGGGACLIVSRFDRTVGDGKLRRIHQEDACQALAIDPEGARGRAKYEDGGGPSLRAVARLLDEHATDPAAQLDRLVETIVFTVLIGNADAHGKNLALLHPAPEEVELAPLYDTVPTALWPKLRRKAAMAIGGQVELAQVSLADICREAGAWPHPKGRAREVAVTAIESVGSALDAEAIPADSTLTRLIRERAAGLLAEAT
jgi:serine/threonine-protein kinase HipA